MNRIQAKITLTYLLLTVAIIGTVGFISSFEIESLFEGRLIRELEQDADAVHFFLAKNALLNERERAAAVQTLAGMWGVRVTLITGAGKVVADSDVPFQDLGNVENHLLRP